MTIVSFFFFFSVLFPFFAFIRIKRAIDISAVLKRSSILHFDDVYERNSTVCVSEQNHLALNHLKVILPYITKTSLYNVDPLKPHFYIVKLGFTWVYIIFLISALNIDCGTR